MASTPELSPPSSAASSDDEYLFFSALSTSAFPLILQAPAHISSATPKTTVQHDDIKYEGISLQDTPNPVDSFPRTVPVQTPTKISWGQLPLPSPKRGADSQTHQNVRKHRSDSLPHTLHRHLHRPSHPSFVKFTEILPPNEPQLHGLRSPHPRCISNTLGTEALISLAWTGEISSPTVASGYAPSRIGNTYMWPKLRISDAEMITTRRASWPGTDDVQGDNFEAKNSEQIRQPHSDKSPTLPKRWTLADAISDDEVTDEKLVELLEELRLRRPRPTERSTSRFFSDVQTPTMDTPTHCDIEPNDMFPSPQTTIPDDVSKDWSTARRILLVCRELIRTERHYFLSLKALVNGETQPPPSSLMLSRLPALIRASGRLLELMKMNPSVLGICAAFIQVYELLEEAFVQWCEVVGEFFTADSDRSLGSSVKRSNTAPVGSGPSDGETGSTLLTKRVGSWSKKMHSKSLTIDDITSMVTRNVKAKPHHKSPVRDLAIMPTQRITRYVLLFKDLLIHSPPFDARATIEHAAEAAMTLARKADGAQGHAAFHMAPA